jgi:hypothetical protein
MLLRILLCCDNSVDKSIENAVENTVDESIENIMVIYSCYKYLPRAEKLYNYLNGKLTGIKLFILIGDLNIDTDYKIINEKIIIKCEDTYSNLTKKTMGLIKFMHDFYPTKNLIKCDEDNLINIDKFNELKFFGDYLGKTTIYTKDILICPSNEKVEHFRPAVTYCNGYFYYLSSFAISKLANNNNEHYFWEDITIAKNLFNLGIKPINYDIITIKYNQFCSKNKAIFNDYKREYEPDGTLIKNIITTTKEKVLNKKQILRTPINGHKIPKKELMLLNKNESKTKKKEIPAKTMAPKQKSVPKENIGESIKHYRSPRLAPVLLRQTSIRDKHPKVSTLPQKIPN